jgi:hypothetical protein
MPNGGVPIQLIMRPRASETMIVYCHGGELKMFARADWDDAGISAEPLLSLTGDEGLVLERFLRYWLEGDRPGQGPVYQRAGVDVAFEF